MIDIKGLSKAKVLCALYNNSKPQGLGIIHFRPADLTEEEASKLLKETDYFDYLAGRVMKVKISGDELDEWLYDRDNGRGAAARAIDLIR